MPQAQQAPPEKPFEKVLDEQEALPAKGQPAAPKNEKVEGKPVRIEARKLPIQLVNALPATPGPVGETLPSNSKANASEGEQKPLKLRADALPLPGAAAIAPASTEEGDATNTVPDQTPGSAPAPAIAVDAPLATATELAEAAVRESSGAIPALQSTEPRVEALEPAVAKAPPAPPPPADSSRAGEILRQMRVQLSPDLRSATIQLSPPELGRISIRMRVAGGELHAVVRAERRETLAALQQHVPELKATLDQLGIHARQFDLQLGFERHGAPRNPHDSHAGGRSASETEQDSTTREHEQRLARTLSARAGGVDTYA